MKQRKWILSYAAKKNIEALAVPNIRTNSMYTCNDFFYFK